MIGGRGRSLLAALVLVAACGAAQAQAPSEAERAAQAERALTPEEIARRRTGCALSPVPDGTVRDVLGRSEVPAVRLPAIRVLSLIQLRRTGPAADDHAITRFDPLPFGGLGSRDSCGMVELRDLADPSRAGPLIASIGLRMRSDLDILRDYPTTGAEMLHRDQVVALRPARYLEFRGDTAAFDWDGVLKSGDARIARAVPAIVLGDAAVLIPLADPPG